MVSFNFLGIVGWKQDFQYWPIPIVLVLSTRDDINPTKLADIANIKVDISDNADINSRCWRFYTIKYKSSADNDTGARF